MNQPKPPQEKSPSSQLAQQASIFAIGGEVGCLTLVVIFAALIGGILLDRLLGTKPVFTLILLLGSAPLALYITFWVATRAVKKYTPQQPSTREQETKIVDEEEHRE